MARPLFAFDGVILETAGRCILDRLTLDIPDGGVTVVLGPSGAGKSTLLRLCNRLELATSGSVRFRGDEVTGLDPLTLRRRVGMVFQRPAPFPGTVRANLLVAQPGAEEPAQVDALERSGLDRSFLDRVADELSGGEAQRACLARTIITEPEVLLLDEPTASIDPVAARDLEASARMLADSGVPVVWVSHDLAQADRIADEVAVLVDGRVATDHERRHFLNGERHDHTDEPDG